MRYLSPIFVRNDSTDCVGPASQPSSRSRISAVTGVPLRVSVSVGDAFNSPLFGPTGLMIENRVLYLRKACTRTVLPMPRSIQHKVALLPATLSADTALLEHVLALGYDALVVSAFGAGHVSVEWVDLIDQITTEIPVLVATRTGSGPTTEASYGFIGSEMDLIDRGAVMCGFLCPYKARILIWLLIGAGMGREVAKHVQRLGFKAAEA